MDKRMYSITIRSMTLLVLAVVFAFTPAFGAVTPAQAQTCQYWVAPAPAGNNANPGTSLRPWATLNYASARLLSLRASNCTVWVKDGIYNGTNELEERFSTMMTFKAVNPYKAVIQHRGMALEISGARNITFMGFEFRHSGATTNPLVVYVSQSDNLWAENIIFRNNIFHDSYNNDILKIANGSRYITLTNNIFYNQAEGEQHIDVNSVTDVVIQDNIFFNDFAGSGRPNGKDTKHFIVIKDSNDNSDGLLGAQRITLRRNIFLHYQGEVDALIQVGNDGKPYYEANIVRVENNLIIGNNPDEAGYSFGVSGAQNVAFVNNTVVGNFPSSAYAYRIVIKGQNPVNRNIVFYNNIWSDPTRTMGSGLSGLDNDFSSGNAASVSGFVLNNNLYWNGGAAIPPGDVGSPMVTDTRRVVANPLLNTNQNGIVLPRWNGVKFLSGNTIIRHEFVRLVNQYGQIPAGSAAVNKGLPTYAPSIDILQRPRGASPDMGAFEYGATFATSAPTQAVTSATATATVTPATATNTALASPTATAVTQAPVTSTPTLPPVETEISTLPSTPTQPSTGADLIFADGLESGDFSAWTSNKHDGGDLTVSPEAALAGGYGMNVVIDDSNPLFVSDERPAAEARYRARFSVDPNSIAMAGGNGFYILNGYLDPSTAVVRIELGFANGAYQVRARVLDDGTKWLSTPWAALSDEAHSVELDWRAATASGANDGGLGLWVDGQPAGELTGVDNDTRRIEQVRWGAVYGMQDGTRGTIFLDDFESRR